MPTEQQMRELLNKMYIARNITLNSDAMQECLKQIDVWFSSESGRN